MTPEQEKQLLAALPEKPSGPKLSASAQLVELALAKYRFVRGQDGRSYAVPKDGPGLAQPLRGEGSVRKHLAAALHSATGIVANANALTDALVVLDARADDTEPQPVHQRVAPTAEGVLIDLGRPDQLVVRVTPAGWAVRPLGSTDPLFKRTQGMGILSRPVPEGSLEPLWGLLNVRPSEQSVLVGWMAAAFLPLVAQPFVLFRGEQGTGKTTAARLLLSLLDPGPSQMTSTPRTEKDFGVAAQGRTVLGMDNLSTITPALSDTICRAVTGESIVSRSLFTDDALSILSYRIALIVTTIDPGALRGDLAERMLPIQLEPLARRRRTEQELLTDFETAKPAVLGAVLDEVAAVLRSRHHAVEPEAGWPRMADFGKVLGALDHEHGTTGLKSYLEMTTDSEMDVLAGDPLSDAVLRLARTGPWRGTPTDLLAELTRNDEFTKEERRGWRTAQEMSQTLTRLSKGLRLVGLSITRGRSGGARYIDIAMVAELT